MAVHHAFPYLRLSDAAGAIDWYCDVFGATERFRLVEPETGRVGHAELTLGASVLLLSDEFSEYGVRGPETVGDTTVAIHLLVDDADALCARAVERGAELLREPTDQFYGERSAQIRDPFGHEWNIGHAIEEVEPAEMQRRWNAMVEDPDQEG